MSLDTSTESNDLGDAFDGRGRWKDIPELWDEMTPERVVYGRQIMYHVTVAIETLPPSQRAALVLRAQQELKRKRSAPFSRSRKAVCAFCCIGRDRTCDWPSTKSRPDIRHLDSEKIFSESSVTKRGPDGPLYMNTKQHMNIMPTCRELAEQADAFLDNETSFAQRLQVRLHISMCKGCARFVNQMLVTHSLITAQADRACVSQDDKEANMLIEKKFMR